MWGPTDYLSWSNRGSFMADGRADLPWLILMR